jgi:hypothetical protein
MNGGTGSVTVVAILSRGALARTLFEAAGGELRPAAVDFARLGPL